MNTRSPATTSRLTALLAALAMMATFVVASATPALASAEGFARLTAGAEVLPGDFTYKVEIEAVDETNLVVVSMPAGIGVTVDSGATLTDDSDLGFTGRVQSVGSLQRVIFSDGVLPAGEEMNLLIPTTVATPMSVSETSGRFDVQLSSDSGRSFSTAQEGQSDGGGTLQTIIRFLEITSVIDEAGDTPLGAQDGSGTEGQAIDVEATVKNYLATPVSVDVALGAVSGDSENYGTDETISPEQRISVGGNGTASAVFDVTLGAAVNNSGSASDRPVKFTAQATEVIAKQTAVRNDALNYEVQIQSRLAVTGSSFDPRAVAPGPATFTFDAAHSGTPAFDITGASINFADTTAMLAADSPASFAPEEGKTLSFTGQVAGADGDFPVQLVYSALDENGYSYTVPHGTLQEPSGGLLGGTQDVLVTIDALAPILDAVIELPDDSEGMQQTEAKNGDTITVEGTIDDDTATLDPVQLYANGVKIAEAPAQRGTFDSSTFTATFEDVQFPLANGSFTALASATDPAGNLGQASSEAEEYDNILPVLISARTESTSDSATSALEALLGDAARISVRFSENNLIIGGCNPNEWTVDGQQTVKEVRFTDGSRCTPGAAGPDNERILVLSTAYDREATPSITYSPGAAAGSVKDGAGNFALENTVTAVTGILPPVPDLVTIYRDTAGAMSPDQCLAEDGPCEEAFFDEDAYWTRFDGNDTVACVAGARAGYRIEVTDGDGNAFTLTRKSTTGSPSCIRVPVNGDDGIKARGVRFINSAGAGPEVLFNMALDTVKPTIDGVTRNGDQVTVDFDDKLVEGEDFAIDWLVYEQLDNGDPVFYSPDSVTAPGEGENIDYTARVLTVDFREYGDFAGIGYEFQSGDFNGERYADRAGNLFDDNVGPVPPNAQ